MPLDVREAVGKTQWRWKLADTLAEARRCLPEAIANTDQLIADLRAGKTVSTRPQQQPRQLAKDLLAGKPAAEVFSSDYFHGTPEEAIEQRLEYMMIENEDGGMTWRYDLEGISEARLDPDTSKIPDLWPPVE